MMYPDMLATMNFNVAYMSLAVGLAILFLLGQRVSQLKWYFSIIAAIIVLAIVGFAGITGADDGRIIAHTKINLTIYGLQAAGWLLAMILTAFLRRKKYSKVRFNLFAALSFFIFQAIGLYSVALVVGGPLAGLAGSIQWILIGALVFAIVQYLVTLPFLILSYRSNEYEKRLMNWLGR